MDSKRIRIPLTDEEGYNREVITKRSYVVVWPNPPELQERIFTDYQDAAKMYSEHDGARIEEVLLVLQIKTIVPEIGPLF